MKRFTRKISAVLIATLLIMTAAPNLAYANDDTDFAPQSEVVAESVQTTDPALAADPEPASDDPAPALDPAPASEPAPAEENTPVVDSGLEVGEEITPEQAPVNNTPTGGSYEIKEEKRVEDTSFRAEEALMKPSDLTVLLRGLNDANKLAVMNVIDQYISVVVNNGTPFYVSGESLIDAEKFSTGTWGYDSQHCWAATAANILWTTGYAQQAINPMTINPQTGKGGRPFASEDEVLTYFSDNFTDYPGVPEDGVNWFMKGTGAYSSELQNMKGVAHYIDANSGGLLVGADAHSWMREIWDSEYSTGAPESISALLSVCAQGMGVLVKWFDGTAISNAAHWMTVVGAIIDDAEDVFSNKYKALIVADSDSDPAHTEAGVDLDETTIGEKLEAKSNRTNVYKAYQLKYYSNLNNNKGGWRLVGFEENENRIAIVSHLYMLLDRDKNPQGDNDESCNVLDLIDKRFLEPSSDGNCSTAGVEETKDAIVITDGLNAIVIAKEDILSALSEAELETSENLENLLEFMTDNNVEIFPQAKGVVSVNSGNNYVAYIKTPVTAKITVSVDGIALPEDAYEIIVLPNGMTKLRIKNSYLKALSVGAHSLQINVEGTDSVISSMINVID